MHSIILILILYNYNNSKLVFSRFYTRPTKYEWFEGKEVACLLQLPKDMTSLIVGLRHSSHFRSQYLEVTLASIVVASLLNVVTQVILIQLVINQLRINSTTKSVMIKYVSPECQQNFKLFKYSGGNDSITYKHFWSPLADRLITLFPTTIAPNAITLSSLILLTVVHVVFMFAGDNSKGVASWKLVMMAVSIFLYQNLDNLDGKQARRTNSSSPLGMLFDHGTDAVASFFISIQVIEFLSVDSSFVKMIVNFCSVMLVYFSAMWAQYSTGYMRLGEINPVDEGLPSYALAALINIYLPNDFWNRTNALGKYNYNLLFVLAVLTVLVIYGMVKDNFKNAIRAHKDIKKALLLPLTYVCIIILIQLVKPQAYIMATLPIFYLLTFSWSRNMIEIQVYFVTKQEFNPFNLGTLSFAIPAVLFLFLDVDPYNYFCIATVVSFFIFLEFVVSICQQGSKILGIYVFSLGKREKEQ